MTAPLTLLCRPVAQNGVSLTALPSASPFPRRLIQQIHAARNERAAADPMYHTQSEELQSRVREVTNATSELARLSRSVEEVKLQIRQMQQVRHSTVLLRSSNQLTTHV